MKRLGWKKDRYDKRDYLHKFKAVKLPNAYSIRPAEVRDQGSLSSCVGFGIGGNLSSVFPNEEWFSPTWIYNGARFIDGSLDIDCGAYPRDGFEWIRAKGCLKEHFWPYDGVLDRTPPPSKFDPEAAKYPIITYYRVTGGVRAICEAISEGHCVSLGTPWFNAWMEPKDGILPKINKRSYAGGGHETFLYGYNLKKKVFYGQNSWSEDWGNKGKYTMLFQAFNVFKFFGGYDAHYVLVDWVSETDVIVYKNKKVTVYCSVDGGNKKEIGSFDI